MEGNFKKIEYEDGMMVTLTLTNLLCHTRCLIYLGMSCVVNVLTPSGSSVCVLKVSGCISFLDHLFILILYPLFLCGVAGHRFPLKIPHCRTAQAMFFSAGSWLLKAKCWFFLFYFNKLGNGGYFPSCNSLDWIHRSFYADLEHLYFSYMTRC